MINLEMASGIVYSQFYHGIFIQLHTGRESPLPLLFSCCTTSNNIKLYSASQIPSRTMLKNHLWLWNIVPTFAWRSIKYFRLYMWYIIMHGVIVPFCLISFTFQSCSWSKCSLYNVIRAYYFHCINTAVRVKFLFSFSLSYNSIRLSGTVWSWSLGWSRFHWLQSGPSTGWSILE